MFCVHQDRRLKNIELQTSSHSINSLGNLLGILISLISTVMMMLTLTWVRWTAQLGRHISRLLHRHRSLSHRDRSISARQFESPWLAHHKSRILCQILHADEGCIFEQVAYLSFVGLKMHQMNESRSTFFHPNALPTSHKLQLYAVTSGFTVTKAGY